MEGRRKARQGPTGVFHADVGHAAPGQVRGKVGLAHHRDRARLHRLTQVIVGVEALAPAGDEESSRGDAVVPLRDGPDLELTAGRRTQTQRVVHEGVEAHGYPTMGAMSPARSTSSSNRSRSPARCTKSRSSAGTTTTGDSS